MTRCTALSRPSAIRSNSPMPYRRPTGRASPEPTRAAARARSLAGRASRRACASASPAATTRAPIALRPNRNGDNPASCDPVETASPAANTSTVASATPKVDVSRRRRIADPPSFSVAALEPESDASHRGDEVRSVRVVAELAPQPGHVHVERLGRSPPLAVPDLPHDLISGHDLAGLGDQQVQQVELLGGEIELGGAEPGPAGVGVDSDPLDDLGQI